MRVIFILRFSFDTRRRTCRNQDPSRKEGRRTRRTINNNKQKEEEREERGAELNWESDTLTFMKSVIYM